jgi:hypothetical protein
LRSPSAGGRCAAVPRRRCHGPTQRQITPRDETRDAPLQRPAIEKNVPCAHSAAQTYIGTEPIHQPIVTAARVSATQPDDVAEPKLDDGGVSGRHSESRRWGK